MAVLLRAAQRTVHAAPLRGPLVVLGARHRASAEAPTSQEDGLFSVAGQRVVITGGAQGIGRAIAEGFARRGSQLFLLDLEREAAERCATELCAAHPACQGAVGLACDVRDERLVREAAEAVAASPGPHGGAADVLVNCAGVTRRMPAEDFPLEEFDRIQSTNVRGSWCAATCFGKQMLAEGRGGCIINIDSFVTASVLKHVLPYSISKAGVQAMTKGLALEWGPRGIRVNGLAPGLILTPISEALWRQDHMRQWALDQTPLARMGSVEDLVGTAVFLASPAARFITGQTIRVDGGLSAGRHWPIGPPSSAGSTAATGTKQAAQRSFSTQTRGFSSSVGGVPASTATADFNYRSGNVDFTVNPFEGDGVEVNKQAGAVQGFSHSVLNGREDDELMNASGEGLQRRGIFFRSHVSPVRDFYNNDEVKTHYYPWLLAEAKRLMGADKAVVASHVVRNAAAPGSELTPKEGVRGGAFMVHGDFSDILKGQLVEMLESGRPCMAGKEGLDLQPQELREGRLAVLNFWRPLCEEPLQTAPMAVLDAQSVKEEDLSIYVHDPQPPPQNYTLPLPNKLTVASSAPYHRWFTFPGMTRDEVLVFKTYDSAGPQPGNGVGVHSAFHDPSTKPGAPARESIEARVLCFIGGGGLAAGKAQPPAAAEGGKGSSGDEGAKWQRGSEELAASRPRMENVERLAFYRWLEANDGWAGAVGLTAKFTVPVTKVDIFLDIMRENIAGTRQEPGMVQYDLVPDYEPGACTEGMAVYWLLERFASRQALLMHVKSEHYHRCQERFLKDMGGHPLVQIGLYRIDPVEPTTGQ